MDTKSNELWHVNLVCNISNCIPSPLLPLRRRHVNLVCQSVFTHNDNVSTLDAFRLIWNADNSSLSIRRTEKAVTNLTKTNRVVRIRETPRGRLMHCKREMMNQRHSVENKEWRQENNSIEETRTIKWWQGMMSLQRKREACSSACDFLCVSRWSSWLACLRRNLIKDSLRVLLRQSLLFVTELSLLF